MTARAAAAAAEVDAAWVAVDSAEVGIVWEVADSAAVAAAWVAVDSAAAGAAWEVADSAEVLDGHRLAAAVRHSEEIAVVWEATQGKLAVAIVSAVLAWADNAAVLAWANNAAVLAWANNAAVLAWANNAAVVRMQAAVLLAADNLASVANTPQPAAANSMDSSASLATVA